MRYTCAAFAALLCSSAVIEAQTPPAAAPVAPAGQPAETVTAPVAPAPAPAAATAPQPLLLPGSTEVIVSVADTLTTKDKKLKVGDKFKISTVADVMVGDQIVIPKGTTGLGTITYRKGPGSFGKAGKLEVAFNSLTLNGREIALTGRYRDEGKGNGGAAIGAVVAAGVIAGVFVKGHSAEIGKAEQLKAYTAEAVTF